MVAVLSSSSSSRGGTCHTHTTTHTHTHTHATTHTHTHTHTHTLLLSLHSVFSSHVLTHTHTKKNRSSLTSDSCVQAQREETERVRAERAKTPTLSKTFKCKSTLLRIASRVNLSHTASGFTHSTEDPRECFYGKSFSFSPVSTLSSLLTFHLVQRNYNTHYMSSHTHTHTHSNVTHVVPENKQAERVCGL